MCVCVHVCVCKIQFCLLSSFVSFSLSLFKPNFVCFLDPQGNYPLSFNVYIRKFNGRERMSLWWLAISLALIAFQSKGCFLDNNVQQRSFVPFHLWFIHSYIFISVLRAFMNGLTQDSSPTIWCLLHGMGQRKGEQKRSYQKKSENSRDLRINKGS